MNRSPSLIENDWTGEDVSIAQIERELARLRSESAKEGAQPNLRTSVMTHIAWERTERWRSLLASLWPEVAEVRAIRVQGTRAQGQLLAGWLRSRLGHGVEVEVDERERLEGIDLDGRPAPFPPGQPPNASDVLSAQLDRFARDPIYEAAVRAAAA